MAEKKKRKGGSSARNGRRYQTRRRKTKAVEPKNKTIKTDDSNQINSEKEVDEALNLLFDDSVELKEVPIEKEPTILLVPQDIKPIEKNEKEYKEEVIDMPREKKKDTDIKKTKEENKETKKKSKVDTLKKKANLDEKKKTTEVKESKPTENSDINKSHTNTNDGIYISYNTRLLINVVGIIIFFVLSLVFLVSSISVKARRNVLYNQASNLDYKVYLKPNDYYKEPYLGKNMQYIANLIDNIDISFNYNFSANQNINYTYMYYVKSDVSVTDTDDKSKVIYSKSDRLTEPVTINKENSNGFTISQNAKINYSEYNDLVKSFKSSYGISANSNLVLSLCIEIRDEKGNLIRSTDSADTMKITIPLTEQMIDIKMDYKEVNNSNNVSIYKDFSISNQITLALSIISIIISLGFLVRLIMFINKTSPKKTLYDLTLAKILREYDRVIVDSKKIVNMDGEVIDVKSFNELLDVRDNIEKPIIFSEVHKGLKSIFIVKTSNETYRYVLKLADLERKDHKNK